MQCETCGEIKRRMLNDIFFYSEEGLQRLAHDQIWKGKGTEDDPFEIKNANILGQAILIKNSSLHITFVSCNFHLAQFDDCCNIILKDCNFEKLVLNNCMSIKINTSFISNLKLSRIKEISFKKTIIIDISTKFKRIKNITLEDCQINNDFLNYIMDKVNRGIYNKFKEIILSFVILLFYFISFRLFWATIDLGFSDIVNFVLISGLIISLLLFLLLCFCDKGRN